jgi:outer membrane immunogenic protein
VTASTGEYSIDGGFIGGTAGHNWQHRNWVFGLEGDISYSWIEGATSSNPTWNCNVANGCQAEVNWFATLRGRVGYAVDAWLPYVTGGLAYGNVHLRIENCGCDTDIQRAGWTVGGGVERRLNRGWSAKLEYLHVDFGDFFFQTFNPGAIPADAKASFDLIRVGLNRRL